MRSSYKSFFGSLGLLAAQIQLARSHAVIIAVPGDNGVTGAGFGMGEHIPPSHQHLFAYVSSQYQFPLYLVMVPTSSLSKSTRQYSRT
jgi:hypothetical protein